jgi:hypothetical protein
MMVAATRMIRIHSGVAALESFKDDQRRKRHRLCLQQSTRAVSAVRSQCEGCFHAPTLPTKPLASLLQIATAF